MLTLLSKIYGHAMQLRRAAYRRGLVRAHPSPVPVIVVGNLLIGGTGKTPLVIALAEQLGKRGWRVGVASRGYRRTSRGARWVEADDDAKQAGDEALLIRRRCGVPVRVDVNRPQAVVDLHTKGCNLVISDDGFQHLRLDRAVNILVFDERGLGNRRCLPAGPLREPPQAMADATMLIGNQILETELPDPTDRTDRADRTDRTDRTDPPNPPRFTYQLTPLPLCTLDGAKSPIRLADLAGQPVRGYAGIARPERFFALLRQAGLELTEHPFPDHHNWRAADFADVRPDDTVLMTEKDAVKCAGLTRQGRVLVLPVTAELPPECINHIDRELRRWTSTS